MSAPMGSLGRAAYAEERRVLRDDLLSRYHSACNHDARTVEGRLRWGLYEALRALGVDPSASHEGALSYDRAIGQVFTSIDCVDVGIYPLDGEDRDPMPIRLVVTDGADGTPSSSAYLSPAEARELIGLLTEAIRCVKAAWSDDCETP